MNNWFHALAEIWIEVNERAPGTSVGAPGRANEGQASGPFVRFVEAALRPVLGDSTPSLGAIRARVRQRISEMRPRQVPDQDRKRVLAQIAKITKAEAGGNEKEGES